MGQGFGLFDRHHSIEFLWKRWFMIRQIRPSWVPGPLPLSITPPPSILCLPFSIPFFAPRHSFNQNQCNSEGPQKCFLGSAKTPRRKRTRMCWSRSVTSWRRSTNRSCTRWRSTIGSTTSTRRPWVNFVLKMFFNNFFNFRWPWLQSQTNDFVGRPILNRQNNVCWPLYRQSERGNWSFSDLYATYSKKTFQASESGRNPPLTGLSWVPQQ